MVLTMLEFFNHQAVAATSPSTWITAYHGLLPTDMVSLALLVTFRSLGTGLIRFAHGPEAPQTSHFFSFLILFTWQNILGCTPIGKAIGGRFTGLRNEVIFHDIDKGLPKFTEDIGYAGG